MLRSALAFWAWNGDMCGDEIEEQIKDFSEKGFAGFFIHSRAGVLVPYLSDGWFTAVKRAVKAAEKYGITVWLYDEDGWPSGFAGGKVLSKGEDYCIKTLRFTESMPADKDVVIAAYEKTEKGYALIDKAEVAADLYCYYTVDKHYADLLNPSVTQEFIRQTHEVYKSAIGEYFGSTVLGIFTDEPQMALEYPYSFAIGDRFEEKYGYRPETRFWELYATAESAECNEFRLQYRRLCSELFHQNYTAVIADWCEKNHLIMTGHFAGEDGLCTSNLSGSVMNGYRCMQMPGIDFLGRRLTSPVLLKQIAGERSIWGKKAILSETFGCCGWNTSMAQYRHIWGYQAAFGLNVPCMHFSAYTIKGIRKRDYPAFFSYQEPWWRDFGAYLDWTNRLDAFVSEGENVSDVLVISPLRTVMSLPVGGDRARQISCSYRSLVKSLLDSQIYFDVTEDDIAAENARVYGNALCLGNKQYARVLIPPCDLIDKKLYEKLQQACKVGVNIVFVGEYPKYLCDENCTFIPWTAPQSFLVMNRTDLVRKYFESTGYVRPFKVVSRCDAQLSAGLVVNAYKLSDHTYHYLVMNTSTEDVKRCLLYFSHEIGVEVYDPATDISRALSLSDGWCEFTFEPMSTVLFRGTAAKEAYPVLCSEERLWPKELRRLDDNVFTIDKGSYSIDGGDFSEEMPVAKLQQRVFEKAGERLCVRYRFYVKDVPQRISLAGEFADAESVTVNGITVAVGEEWWLDKSIKKTDISACVCSGENVIEIVLALHSSKKLNLSEIFETERNRFFYPTEVENVYILGNFSVECRGESETGPNYYRIRNADFILSKEKALRFGRDIVWQGLPFYRGGIGAIYKIKYPQKGERVKIFAPSSAAVTEIYVDGEKAGCLLSATDEADITEYLKKPISEVEAVYVFSNRNTLGPHHHRSGEPNFVGVNTFNGTKGFEDYLIDPAAPEVTWDDGYAFVKNTIDPLTVRQYREGTEGEYKEEEG